MSDPKKQTKSEKYLESFTEITKEAERRQALSDDYFAYSAERSKKKDYNERRLNDKQALADMVFLYEPYAEDDKELNAILSKIDQLSKMDITVDDSVWKEGEIYEKTVKEVQAYVEKQVKFQEEQAEKIREQFKKSDNAWMTEEEIAADPKLKAEYDKLNKLIDDSEDKMLIGQNIAQYVEAQRNGRLAYYSKEQLQNMDPEDAARIEEKDGMPYFVDATGQEFIHEDRDMGSKTQTLMKVTGGTKDLSQYPLFPHEPSPDDVAQGLLGDCFFVSQLSSMARLHPERLKDSIVENPDGKTVTVRFFAKNENGAYNPVYVKVDKAVERFGGMNIGTEGGYNCLWVDCFERALAASGLWDSYNQNDEKYYKPVPEDIAAANKRYQEMAKQGDISDDTKKEYQNKYPWLFDKGKYMGWPRMDSISGGDGGPVAEMLYGPDLACKEVQIPDNETGVMAPADDTVPTEYSDAEKKFAAMVHQASVGKASMTAGSKHASKDVKVRVADGHEYSLVDSRVDEKTGLIFVKLRNPWGKGTNFVRNIDGNALITTFNKDGSRSYKWGKTEDGYFEMELRDFEHDFNTCSINGYDRINVYEERKPDARPTEMIADEACLKTPDKALALAMKLALNEYSGQSPIIGHQLKPSEDYLEEFVATTEEKYKGDKDKSIIASDGMKAITSYYDTMQEDLNKFFKENPKATATEVLSHLYNATVEFKQKQEKDPTYSQAFKDKLGVKLFSPIHERCREAVLAYKRDGMLNKNVRDVFDRLKTQLDKEKAKGTCMIKLTEGGKLLDVQVERPIEDLVINEDGVMMARNYAGDKVVDTPFADLWHKFKDATLYDPLDPERDFSLAVKEEKEAKRLPDGKLDYKTFRAYSESLEKVYKDLCKSTGVFSKNSKEYKDLKNAIKDARKTLVKLNGKPIEDLKSTMNELSAKTFAYEKHCFENPKTGKVREGRLAALEDLKKIAVCANKEELDPRESSLTGEDYVEYSKEAQALRTSKDKLAQMENSALNKIVEGFEKKNKQQIINNASFIIYAERLKSSVIDDDLIQEGLEPDVLEGAITMMEPITEQVLIESKLQVGKDYDAAKLGKELRNDFHKKLAAMSKTHELEEVLKATAAQMDGKKAPEKQAENKVKETVEPSTSAQVTFR